jgi:hypothetical protein
MAADAPLCTVWAPADSERELSPRLRARRSRMRPRPAGLRPRKPEETPSRFVCLPLILFGALPGNQNLVCRTGENCPSSPRVRSALAPEHLSPEGNGQLYLVLAARLAIGSNPLSQCSYRDNRYGWFSGLLYECARCEDQGQRGHGEKPEPLLRSRACHRSKVLDRSRQPTPLPTKRRSRTGNALRQCPRA